MKYHVGKGICKQGQLAVGCSAVIFDSKHERILLVRRADNGRWTVPGGYMEPGESLTEACAREVLEETGLQVKVTRLISVYTTPDILLEYPDGNRLQLVVLHFETEPTGGELRTSDETTELKYFTQAETLELEMIDGLNRVRIADSFTAQQTTIVRETF